MDGHQGWYLDLRHRLFSGTEKGSMTPKQKIIIDAALEVAAVLQNFTHEEREQIVTVSGQLILSEDYENRDNPPPPPSKIVSINRR